MILFPRVFALEQQLEFWGQVGHTGPAVQHSIGPRKAHTRISPVYPLLIIPVPNGDIDQPGIGGDSATPKVVLTTIAGEIAACPGCQHAGYSEVDVPTCEQQPKLGCIAAADPDVGVVVVPPRPFEVKLQRPAARYPPPKPGWAEDPDDAVYTHGFPAPNSSSATAAQNYR